MLSYRSGREGDLEESRPLLRISTGGTVGESDGEVRRIDRIPSSSRSYSSVWIMVGIVTLIPVITFMIHSTTASFSSSSSIMENIADSAIRNMYLQANSTTTAVTADPSTEVPGNVVPKDIEASSSICSITTTLNHVSYNCKGSYINFIVPATANGLWPEGLTYSLFEAGSDNMGLLSKFHYEQGPANLPERTSCESFSSVMCLAGDFTLNVNEGGGLNVIEGDDASEADRNSMYVDICGSDHRVHAGDSYEFSTYKLKCSSLTDSDMIPISEFQRRSNASSTLKTSIGMRDEKSATLLDSVTNYFHEIFDPNPVTDEPEETVDLQEKLNPEITDPTPVEDEPEDEKVIDEVKLTHHISSTANTALSQESAVLKNSENIGQTADTIRDLILKHNQDSSNFMAEIHDEAAVTEEDYSAREDQNEVLALVKKISHLSDSNEATTSTLLASSSSTVQDADALGDLLDTGNHSVIAGNATPPAKTPIATARTVPAKAAKPTPKAAPPASPHEDGTLNPWSLNPQTGSSKVPVAKEERAKAKTTSAENLKIKKKRRLLGKGGVRNVEAAKSKMKLKNKVKKQLKLREQVSA